MSESEPSTCPAPLAERDSTNMSSVLQDTRPAIFHSSAGGPTSPSSVVNLQPLPSLPKPRKSSSSFEQQKKNTFPQRTARLSSTRAVTSQRHLPYPRRASPPQSCDSPSLLSSLVHSTAPLLPISTQVALPSHAPKADVKVQCKARTRVPTPHGPVFLHIYHNNLDSKEHLAIVVDPEQLSSEAPPECSIRSKSLDAIWHENETETERLIRGAYVGRLSSSHRVPSTPSDPTQNPSSSSTLSPSPPPPPPIIRIHSECYTGETIGSMRCDCGEQLDEAIRYISQPQLVPSPSDPSEPLVYPARGAVIYMRQEGRGIGLLEKIRAYNLQDMGHDTVEANLLLGHGADERGYDVAAAILQDLGLGSSDERGGGGGGVRILTNNPDKTEALRKEGIIIKDRLPMVPRTWSDHSGLVLGAGPKARRRSVNSGAPRRMPGATMIGGGAATGIDLERYLRTKVEKMGHLLELPTLANSGPSGAGIIEPNHLQNHEQQSNGSVLTEVPILTFGTLNPPRTSTGQEL